MSSDKKEIETTIRILRVGAPEELRTVMMPEEPGYDLLRRTIDPLLDGGRLEHVNVLVGDDYTDMFVDDESVRKELPRNEPATTIYRNNWLTHNPGTDPESLPAIYGPAVVFGRRVWF